MTVRDNTRILAAAQARGLNVSTSEQGHTVIAKGKEQVRIRAFQDGPGAPFAYDYLRVSDGETWRFGAKEALALVESGMTATHLGKSVADLSPAELLQRLGEDRGSTRANRAAAYRQQGFSGKVARSLARADEAERRLAAKEPAWRRGLSPEAKEEAKAQQDKATRAARAERDSRLGGWLGHPSGMSPEAIRRELGRDGGSDRLNLYEAYRRTGYPAAMALGKVRRQEQANGRSDATADRDHPAPRVSEIAGARMRQRTEGAWEQRLEAAAAAAARTLRQERERDRGRGR